MYLADWTKEGNAYIPEPWGVESELWYWEKREGGKTYPCLRISSCTASMAG